jgi:LCP family protein required for cell wall assembly
MSDLPPPPPPQQPPQRPQGPPEYKVYRSRKRLRDRFGPLAGNPLDKLRKRSQKPGDRPPLPGEPKPRRKITPWRVVKWVLLAMATWLLIALVVFFISAQTTRGVNQKTEDALSPGGSVLTGSTILVLGSDQRAPGSKEPGANTGPARADSILLLRVGFGSVRKLSILRDTAMEIPGHGTDKVNASFAFGGAPLTIETIENFFNDDDFRINHIILVNFNRFPDLIDALGGVDVTLKGCLHSNSFGGKTVRLSKGDHHLDGQQALRFARVRQNRCNPTEDDRARAARQQQVLDGMRSQIVSPLNWPSSFIRAPFIAYEAPRAIRSDMHGPGLSALFIDLLTGGTGETSVLKPDGVDGTQLTVSEATRADALDKFLGR